MIDEAVKVNVERLKANFEMDFADLEARIVKMSTPRHHDDLIDALKYGSNYSDWQQVPKMLDNDKFTVLVERVKAAMTKQGQSKHVQVLLADFHVLRDGYVKNGDGQCYVHVSRKRLKRLIREATVRQVTNSIIGTT